ncbi:hypothetical protein [Sulfurimonas sp. HSL3-7]|uniref:hypothetical protein n=1 Tax=Sulfonitrofixus jiaomeiensis TaxID=3131938 RepID=UPI0031F746C9
MRLRSILPNRLHLFIYLAVMLSAGLLFSPSHFSTDMLSIFPQNSYTAKLEDASKLQSLNRLIIISKGSDGASKERIEKIADKLQNLDAVDELSVKVDSIHSPAAKYLREHYAERLDINSSRVDAHYIQKRLLSLYEEMQRSFLFSGLNTTDPLALFSDPMQRGGIQTKNGIALFEGENYMLSAMLRISVADVEGAQKLYDDVHAVVDSYGSDVTAFAPHFFTAENSARIKSEVNLIITATMVLLLLFYAFSLRDFKVLLLTSLALGSSLFVGLAAVTFFFKEVSIFTLAFGSGIAMMAVDYFFHYYFHGYYTRKEKSRKKVFYAFLTTVSGFGILYFADFPLIRQLALFGMASLAFSYFQFSFLFASWQFEPKEKRIRLRALTKGFVNAKIVLAISLVLLGFSLGNLHFSGDLRQLDYQNDKLLALQEKIKSGASEERAVLVYANSLDALLSKMEAVQKEEPSFRSLAQVNRSQKGFTAYLKKLEEIDFQALRDEIERAATKIGFRPGIFGRAYSFAEELHYAKPDLNVAKALGFETLHLEDGRWMSLAFVNASQSGRLRYDNDLVLLEASTLLQKGVEEVLEQLLLIAVMTFGLITLLLVVLLKKRVLVAMNYVLFPLGIIAAALALIGSFSVMHLFALIIVMVAAIDYGIYMSDVQDETDEAIYYAMLTTFAGFGIFVFSHIGALHHIGLVIALGIASTFILQTLQKRTL